MIKRFIIAAVLVVLLCGGLVGFNLFRAKAIADYFATQQMPAVTVSTVQVEATSWTPQIEAIGTLLAAQGVDVAVQTAGVVKSLEFRANDEIKADQMLAQIDDAVERADLQSAQAAVERDRAALKRAQTLSTRGVNSEASLETAQTALAASESALARIQATIDLKAIEAPFAGVIGIPRVDVGQYVQPGTVIATLQQLATMRVDFTVPEQRMADIDIGQPAQFGLTADDFPYAGRIVGVDPKIDPQTRLISVRAEVDNSRGELRPGQFVRVRVDLPAMEGVVALPQTSVVTSLYGDYVYLVEPAPPKAAAPGTAPETETPAEQPPLAAAPAAPAVPADPNAPPALVARQVFVEVGRRQGALIEVVKGVSPGQAVVTSGQNKLSNNAPVTVNNKVDPAALALEIRATPL
jgi:membrane fusion protein (multidrug efflux system)